MGLTFKINNTYIKSVSTVGGKKEFDGPLGLYIDKCYRDLFAGEKTYEDGEIKMISSALEIALKKAKMNKNDVELVLAGDLSNQISTSSITSLKFASSFIGVYAACATSILSLGLGGLLISSSLINNALIYTSSNYGSAERQFRYPTSYGIKKKDVTTITVSGSSAIILSNKKDLIKIDSFTIGETIDSKTSDASDMGSIMAKACYSTLLSHLKNKNKDISYYDIILTGDLGKIGLSVLKDMLINDNIIPNNIMDAGSMIFSFEKNTSFSGGSGPSCLPLVAFSYFYKKILVGEYKKVLLIATGSLHSKTSVNQKKNIPVIAHALEIERE